MPKHVHKSLQYLSKKKKSTPQPQGQPPSSSRTISSSTSWILRGCKHPKTPSLAFDENNRENKTKTGTSHGAATLSDVDRFLLENFKSLYDKEENEEDRVKIDHERSHGDENEEKAGDLLFESPKFTDPPLIDLSGSNRFFVARASSSGSLIEEARMSLTTTSTFKETGSSSTTAANTNSSVDKAGTDHDSITRASDDEYGNKELSPEDFIMVLKYTVSPYDDFKNSMHEMIEARLDHNGRVDWEFMEELLFCYLNLNDKKSYKFILRAFVDLIVALRQNSGGIPAKPHSAPSDSGETRKNPIKQEM